MSNYRSDAGFAWDFIESLYGGLADRLHQYGVGTWVAYPAVAGVPRALRGSCARAIELDVEFRTPFSWVRVLRTVRRLNVRAVYLSDRSAWNPVYAILRMAGVEKIIVHDHTSGARTPPRGLKRAFKRARHGIPGTLADRVLAVSDFVARRKLKVDLIPETRVTRVWNSVVLPVESGVRRHSNIRGHFGLPEEATVVACASRASPEKGVGNLLLAFETVFQRWDAASKGPPPYLVFMGDGPSLSALEVLRSGLESRDRVFLPGYVEGASSLLGTADVAVVPSVWEEAFGLAALEPMSWGVPVIASRVGGLPEVVRDGEEGILVPPGKVDALTSALERLLDDPEARRTMGRKGEERTRRLFSRERQLEILTSIFEEEMGLAGASNR